MSGEASSCAKCGAERSAGARFCSSCGTAASGSAPTEGPAKSLLRFWWVVAGIIVGVVIANVTSGTCSVAENGELWCRASADVTVVDLFVGCVICFSIEVGFNVTDRLTGRHSR